jgi:hypothetical protein
MEAQPSPTQQAISTASATLALIAGAISVLTAFAYIVAYKYLTAFFAALGCDWAIDLYPPTQIIQTAAPVAVIVASVGFLIWNVYPAASKSEPETRTILLAIIAASTFYGVHLLIEKFATSYRSYFNWPAYFLAFVAACTLATKVVHRILAAQGIAWGSIVIAILAAWSVFSFSGDRGRSHAQETLGQEEGRGQRVFVKGSTDTYRLARIIPYERALIFSEPLKGNRIFRVVAVTELSMEAPSRAGRHAGNGG